MNLPAHESEDPRAQHRALERYYRRQARVYDLTRWSFLRGREALARRAAARLTPTRNTGSGLKLLAESSQLSITPANGRWSQTN
ncbi:MAG: hypothetical protein ACOC6K_03680 [Thermodesulfobacteriota bacterium]